MEVCAQNCLHRFDTALQGVIDNFPVRWAAWLLKPLVLPFGARRPAGDKQGKDIVRLALKPGAFRDRLTRDIYTSGDPADGPGLLEATLAKAIACEEAEKKLERAIRKGEVTRVYTKDWIEDAKAKGILSAEEARDLAELRDMTARVIAVDDFAAADLKREARSSDQDPQSGGEDPTRRSQHIAAE